MLILAIGAIEMPFWGCWRIFWASEAILVCDLEIDPVTLTLTFVGHNVRLKKGQLGPTP